MCDAVCVRACVRARACEEGATVDVNAMIDLNLMGTGASAVCRTLAPYIVAAAGGRCEYVMHVCIPNTQHHLTWPLTIYMRTLKSQPGDRAHTHHHFTRPNWAHTITLYTHAATHTVTHTHTHTHLNHNHSVHRYSSTHCI